MRVAIMQPPFVGWAGFYGLADACDTLILDDLSQYVHKDFYNRNKIRNRNGDVVWLSVPVHAHRKPLNQIEIAGDHWRPKLWRTIAAAYSHAPFWPSLGRLLSPVFEHRWEHLTQLTSSLTRLLAAELGIQTRIVLASELGSTRAGTLERLEDMLRLVDGTVLVNTPTARPMFEGSHFPFPVEWLPYEPQPYGQGGMEWQSHLSVIDLLAWQGPGSLEVIRAGLSDTYESSEAFLASLED